MPAPKPDTIAPVLEALIAALEAGLPQDNDARTALAASLGDAAPKFLAGVFADPESSDAALVRAFLLSPSEDFTAALEPVLAQAELDAAGARELGERLAAHKIRAVAVFADGSRLPFPLSKDDARRFVAMLRPERTASPTLRELFAKRRPDAAARLGAAVRHAPAMLSPDGEAFVAEVVSRARASGESLIALTRQALRFLECLMPGESPEDGLTRRMRRIEAHLKQAERQTEALARSSYEVMMSQGARLPHLDAEALRREATHLRQMAAALGLPLPGADVIDRDLGETGDVDDMVERLA